MNITQPKLTAMHYNLKKACNTMVAVNEISMLQNQQLVEKVQELQGNKKTVFIESDTSYNNGCRLDLRHPQCLSPQQSNAAQQEN